MSSIQPIKLSARGNRLIGGIIATIAIAIFVGGMVTEAKLGLATPRAGTAPTTALASSEHGTTSTTARDMAADPKP